MPHKWPTLVIGIVMSIYWARVLQMVLQARARAGHDANFVPREKVGRLLRFVWIPVVACWIAVPLLYFFRKHHKPGFDPVWLLYFPYLAQFAAVLAIICLIATWICWARMGTSWRMGIDPEDKTQLISTGPYAYVRHPIYAISSLMMLCTMAILPSPVMLAVGAIHLLLLQSEASREERYLISVHGDEYRQYAGKTGRFVPKPWA